MSVPAVVQGVTDVAAQSVERQLAATFRSVKGATVQAYGVDAKGNRVESWAASAIRVSIACALSDSGAELIREQLASTGATVRLTAFTGMIAGQRCARRQHRITVLLDDAAAQKLATVRLEIADEEISTAARLVKEATAEYAEFKKQPGQGTYERTCQVCHKGFVSNWPRSTFCGQICRRTAARAASRAREARKREAREKEKDATS